MTIKMIEKIVGSTFSIFGCIFETLADGISA
jgi:hypothetical protein